MIFEGFHYLDTIILSFKDMEKLSKAETIQLIKDKKITDLKQIDKNLILENEVLDAFLLNNLTNEDIDKSLSLYENKKGSFGQIDEQIVKRNKKEAIQDGRSCMDFKGLIFEDIIDNKGKTKSIQEYREIIKDLREDKKCARNFNGKMYELITDDDLKNNPEIDYFLTNSKEKLEEKECRYETYIYLKDLSFKEAQKEILERYKNHFSVPGGYLLEWIVFEKVFFKDLNENLRKDKKICEYAIMDDVKHYHYFSTELKEDVEFMSKLLKKYPELTEVIAN